MLDFRHLTTAMVMSLASGTTRAQAANSTADAQRVWNKYEAALADRTRLVSLRTRVIKGTFEYRGMQGKLPRQVDHAARSLRRAHSPHHRGTVAKEVRAMRNRWAIAPAPLMSAFERMTTTYPISG